MDDYVGVLELLDLKAETSEEEAVARRQRGGEPLLDSAELAPVLEADAHQRLFDDHAGVEAMLLRDARFGDSPHPACFGDQPPEPVIGLQRITTRRDEIEDFLERLLLQARV